MTPGLAIFVKTPGRSPVKSRLWPAIGQAAAEALYLDCAAAAAELSIGLQQTGHLHGYWAVAEAAEVDEPSSPWQGLPRLLQGEGGLGERMAHVYAELQRRHGAALLIGSDLPQLCASALRTAAEALIEDRADVVIGPSADGGFWLVGGRIALPLAAWTKPRYSTAQARADFLDGLPPSCRVECLPIAHDLDESADLPVVAEALAALPQLGAAQQRVLRRLHALSATVRR